MSEWLYRTFLLVFAWSIVLILGTLNLTCFSHLRFTLSDQRTICLGLQSIFGDENDDSRLLIRGFAWPLLLLSCLTMLLPVQHQQQQRQQQQQQHDAFQPTAKGKSANPILHWWLNPPLLLHKLRLTSASGDPNITLWTLVLVLVPALWVCFEKALGPDTEGLSFANKMSFVANPSGVAAVLSLSFFLIPVAKHSPLLRLFGLSFSQALTFHRVCGWIAFGFSILHGLLYLAKYGSHNINDLKGTTVGRNLQDALIPPKSCFSWSLASYSYDSKYNPTGGKLPCYKSWRNFAGLLSGLCFLSLALTSLPRIRRHVYWLFYSFHIPLAWGMMILLIAHFNLIILYLLPTILYYLAYSFPVWIEQFWTARAEKGIRVASITPIADSGGCYTLRLQGHGDPTGAKQEGLSHLGAVCKICLPQVSRIWHPFSCLQDSTTGDLLFLIRGTGPFTREMSRVLLTSKSDKKDNKNRADNSRSSSTSSYSLVSVADADKGANTIPQTKDTTPATTATTPVVLVDGLYPTEYRWGSACLLHDSALWVAGGVGIVPFINQLREAHETLSHAAQIHKVRNIDLHWYCREAGLAHYVCREHLGWFIKLARYTDSAHQPTAPKETFEDEFEGTSQSSGDSNQVRLNVHIHITSKQEDNDSDILSAIRSAGNEPDAESQIPSQESNQSQVGAFAVINTKKMPEDEKSPWQQAYLLPKQTFRENVVRSLLVAVAFSICGLLHSFHYQHIRHVIWPRTFMIAYVAVIVLTLMLLFIWARRLGVSFLKAPQTTGGVTHMPLKDCEHEDIQDGHSAGPSTSSNENQSSAVDHLSSPSVWCNFEVCAGRPDFMDVVESVVDAKQPGAFFCGPDRLKRSLKASILSERKARGSSLACSFYDEQSAL